MPEIITVPTYEYYFYFDKSTMHTEVEMVKLHGTVQVRIARVTKNFGVQRCPTNKDEWSVVTLYQNFPGYWGPSYKTLLAAARACRVMERLMNENLIKDYFSGSLEGRKNFAKKRRTIRRILAREGIA